jgi:DNA-nicking Smr family endonuclease
MADDPLDPDGRALWRRVTETVRPIAGRAASRIIDKATLSRELRNIVIRPKEQPRLAPAHVKAGETLDGGWDRRLRRGIVAPDMTIDLHGHTMIAAHGALEAGLASALSRQARVILLVTGRPPKDSTERIDGRPVRGAIRASVGDWLAGSRYSGQIAAVRSAHPKHGGAGALYVILRRKRESV